MLELAPSLLAALRAGEPVAVVTIARVARSAPRGPGAAMAVFADGRVVGSISGGCVEADAVVLAGAVLASGRPSVATLGFSDDAAHAVGLACGGSVEVVVHRLDPADAVARAALEAAERDETVEVAIALTGPDAGRAVHLADRDRAASETRLLSEDVDGEDLFVITHRPRPRLVVVGAGEHAVALVRVAAAAGFGVAVCDVWDRLATPERFPDAQRVVVGDPAVLLPSLVGPDPSGAAVCVLTHDERVDVPALAAALTAGTGFVGAMGARSTVAHRRTLLAAAGVPATEIDRIHSPLGLDLGGASPAEAALSTLAEIVATRHGASGRPLRELSGPLHPSIGGPAVRADAAASCVAGGVRP